MLSSDTNSTDTGADNGQTAESGVDSGSTGGETQDESGKTDSRVDKRNVSDQLRRTLKWLEENGGEHSSQANEIRKTIAELKSYKSGFGTVREARDAKLALDAVGGATKIAEMQAYTARMEEIDSMLEAGDPRVLEAILETPASSAGVAKILPDLIQKLGDSHPQEVNKALMPIIINFMDNEGLLNAIDNMVNAFNAGNPDEAKATLARVVNWAKRQLASQQGTSRLDPERQAFEKQKTEFEQTRFQGEVSSTFDKVVSHAETVLGKYIAADAKRLGLSAEAVSLLKQDAWKYLQDARNNDPLFKTGISTRINDQRRSVSADAASFLNRFTDEKAKEAVDKAVRLRYGHAGTKPATSTTVQKTTPTSAPFGGNVKVDIAKTKAKYGANYAKMMLSGKAIGPNGKPIVNIGKGKWKYV